jgi:hypothetical protein
MSLYWEENRDESDGSYTDFDNKLGDKLSDDEGSQGDGSGDE